MILSKTYAPISLLVKSLMTSLVYMNNKKNIKLKLGLGQFSFLSFCYAPDQDSKLIKKMKGKFND